MCVRVCACMRSLSITDCGEMLWGFPFLLGQQENVVQTIILHYSDFVAIKYLFKVVRTSSFSWVEVFPFPRR